MSGARGSDETTLDVEQSGALAPQASIVVYQAPNSDAGNIDAYAAAASQNLAGTVSTSWGESETLLTAGDAVGTEPATLMQANDEFMLEMAAQGQANFTASGDQGAYAASGDIGSTNLSVLTAADSPWTTAAGATTLAGVIPLYSQVSSAVTPAVTVRVPAQRAWGWDWQWPDYSLFLCNTGGYSSARQRPGYQRKIRGIGSFTAVPYLRPAGFAPAPGSTLILPASWNAWDAVSGAAAPPAVVWGKAAGRVAALHGSPFRPEDASGSRNDNLYYTGSRGAIYNPATGLGTPDLARLATEFARFGW